MNGENLNYATMCFVVMPFGTKPVGEVKFDAQGVPRWEGRQVDFNKIYTEVFAPAIAATPLPEGGNLVPMRTDMNAASANIDVLMYRGIEYARVVLSDITGLNANVFYELGVRHHSKPTGTAIFRQADGPIPFDINHIKAFPYEYEPQDKAVQARELITRTLTETLKLNLITSPVQVALQNQWGQPPAVEEALKAAENKVREQDPDGAITEYEKALRLAPDSPLIRFKVGLMHKYKGRWAQALGEFAKAVAASPGYSAAYRELGIAENKLGGGSAGEASLRKAVELDPKDWDAFASLGGMLKRAGRFQESLDQYETAVTISEGHPYPLLNALKLRAKLAGAVDLGGPTRFQLNRAERFRQTQIKNPAPLDSPWSFFDLSEIRLYQGSDADFLKYLDDGIYQTETRAWQAKTHVDSLQFLADSGFKTDVVNQGIAKLKEAESYLPS